MKSPTRAQTETPEPPEVPGDFHVDHSLCMACGAPPAEAPDLMTLGSNHADPRYVQCYFKEQPTTPEEIEQACRAVWASCCGAVKYTGSDPAIEERIAQLEASSPKYPTRLRRAGALFLVLLALPALLVVWAYGVLRDLAQFVRRLLR